MNNFDLKFAKYIQEYAPVSLQDAEGVLGRTESTLKRSIRNINDYLPNKYHISIEKKHISTRLSYSGYMELLQCIQFKDYITTPAERINALVVALSLKDVVNKKHFYENIGVSKTTLKNDREQLEIFLKDYGLFLKPVPRQGSRIAGSESRLRVLASRLIMKVVEVGSCNCLIEHKSNTPIKRLIAQEFLSECSAEIKEAVQIFDGIIARNRMIPSYNHKKFFLVYLTVALKRMNSGNFLCMSEFLEFILPPDLEVFSNKAENHFASLLFSSFTYNAPTVRVYDRELIKTAHHFCDEIIDGLQLTIYNHSEFFEETYNFVYASLVQSKFQFFFEDKKLIDVPRIHHDVFSLIKEKIGIISDNYHLYISETHLSILTLIIKKLVLRNSCGNPRRKLYIVTNSAENKVWYFVETLKAHFNVDILGIVNTNELHRLAGQDYDLIITFTNKISSYLEYYQLECVKVNFNLQEEDFDRLRSCGLSHLRNKIPIEQFKDEIANLSGNELKELLQNKYSDYFI